MTWKEFIYQQIVEYCNRIGSRTFSLQEFYTDKEPIIKLFKPENQHRPAKVRQQLQFLRDDKLITFLDNSGHYTLRGVDLLEPEKQEIKTIDISKESPEKREYLVETYVRSVSWALKAIKIFGKYCIFNKCSNTFLREDGTPYIEVHHIVPLCKGGEDGLWNLSVLCAHHHRMAHYADVQTRINVENYLLKETKCRIGT
ncbi:MAG: HNH endonuclease [Candidatus Desantisbacteria bacterium]